MVALTMMVLMMTMEDDETTETVKKVGTTKR